MDSKIEVVGWDIDRVAHPTYSTSLLAEYAETDPWPKIEEFVEEGRLPEEYVERWQEENREIDSVKDAADMLTDALYEWGQKDGELLPPDIDEDFGSDPVMSKGDTIYTKQKILGNIEKNRAREIAEKMDFIPGFRDAVQRFYEEKIKQTAFSDGADWVVQHLIQEFPYDSEESYFDAGGGVPPKVRLPDGTIKEKMDYEEISEDAEMTGEINDFNKVSAFVDYIIEEGVNLNKVAVIDDSGANVKPLLSLVKDGGGIAVGFNVKSKYESDFEEAGIPIVGNEETGLDEFQELVLNPARYYEMVLEE